MLMGWAKIVSNKLCVGRSCSERSLHPICLKAACGQIESLFRIDNVAHELPKAATVKVIKNKYLT